MDVFDGLLFDLDGTLWDSVDAICISWNRALERLAPEYAGTVTRARLLPCMGMLLPDILHRLVPELDQERMKPILEEVLVEENAYVAAHGGVLYPGVEQTLAALSARCPLFLVSNCQDGYIEAFPGPRTGALFYGLRKPRPHGAAQGGQHRPGGGAERPEAAPLHRGHPGGL